MAKSRIAGRSWKKKQLTLEELAKLLKPFGGSDLFDEDAMDGSLYDIVVVDGDLHFDRDLITFKEKLCGLVVLGDLIVRGRYEDSDDPNTGVFVKGNLRAESVITSGELVVLGDLDAGDALVGYYNDFGAKLRGTVRAKVFVPEQHSFELKGKVDFGLVLGDGEQCTWKGKKPFKPLALRDYPKHVVKTLLQETNVETLAEMEWDEVLDHDALMKKVRKGAPILVERAR